MGQIDPNTEIASSFKVLTYWQIRPPLDPSSPKTNEWDTVLDAFYRRIRERFLKPIRKLTIRYKPRFQPNDPRLWFRPGFVILALDCLLIDTLLSFREGRPLITGDAPSPQTASPFRKFLGSGPFNRGGFNSDDRKDFPENVRNGLLHNGETRGNWKVRPDNDKRMLDKATEPGSRILNPRLFHGAIAREFRAYYRELRSGSAESRKKFLDRMDAICGYIADLE